MRLHVMINAFWIHLCVTLADDPSCSTSHTPVGTFYQVNTTDLHLDVDWMNATHHPLAYQDDSGSNKTDNVLHFNGTHLHLRRCEDIIIFGATDSEGKMLTANCSVHCSLAPGPPGRGRLGLYGTIALLLVLLVFISTRCKLRFNEEEMEDENNEDDLEAK